VKLESQKIWDGGAGMKRGGDADRARGVVGTGQHLVKVCNFCDFLPFSDPSADLEIGRRDPHGGFLKEGKKLVAEMQSLSGQGWSVTGCGQNRPGIDIGRTDGILDPGKVERLYRFHVPERIVQGADPAFDADLDFVSLRRFRIVEPSRRAP